MNTKIVFFDIDGTLINVPSGLNQPSQQTKEALRQIKKQGHKIVIASARGELPFDDDIEFDGYICSEGHYIRYHDEVLINQLFNTQQIEKQLAVYQKYQGVAMFNGNQGQWCHNPEHELVLQHNHMFQGDNHEPIDSIKDFKPEDIKAISCCILFHNVADLRSAAKELENDFTMVLYEKGLIRMDVYCKGYTKGTACQYLYQRLGIDYKNTYAFGDGINDLKMFKLVKYGIAMGNAVDELKAIAYDVTDTVDNDGIVVALKKYFQI